MKDERAKFSWRRSATIAVALIVFGVAAYAVSMLRLRGPAVPPATVEANSPKPPPVASISVLPPEVGRALTSLCSPCVFANSDGPWNATDVVGDGLPQRRLVKTEKRGSDWFVQYQHGGFATHNHTVVFSLAPTVHLANGSSCIPAQAACEW